MQKTDTYRTSSLANSATRGCCTDGPCDSGLRNQYFEGKRLTADSFRVEQSYLLDRRQLLNRAMHGWGVVYGYALKPASAKDGSTADRSGSFEIGPGLALDESGHELLQARTILLGVDDAILLDGKGARIKRPPDGSFEPREKPKQGEQRPRACWLLSAHYAEQQVGPVRISDPCSCERHEWDQVCETVRFSLRQVDCAECCNAFDCELTCGCGTGPCCDEHLKTRSDQPSEEQPKQSSEPYDSMKGRAATKNPVRRGGCECLCSHLTGMSDAECSTLCEIDDPCVHIRADLKHGVPLACVRLREGDCDNWLFDSWVDACGPRRLVKRNDALFDLIRGCDLTRISAIGWADWHRSREPIKWDAFEASFGESPPGSEPRRDLERRSKSENKRKKLPVVTLRYWVEFSRPVRKETLRADCFSMTVFVEEREGGWDEARRVPILGVETWAPQGTPPDLATRATIIVDGGWLSDAVKGAETIFDDDPTTVEIEIRGDLIVDCNGQTVDANAHGLSPAPTGNGTPGGTFFSSFRVQSYAECRVADERSNRTQGVQS